MNIAGPKSRELLQRLTNEDLSNDAFRFMRSRQMVVAGVPVVALRVSFTGDLGWELHCEAAHQVALYTALIEAARDLGGGPVGSRALGSLRIEKGYGSWGREYSPEYWPQELGLERLIKLDKAFLHKDAYLALAENAPRETLQIFEMEARDADASGGEPIFRPDGTAVGHVSSGAYSAHTGKSLALGFAKTGTVQPGDEVEIFVLGQAHKARMLAAPPFDPGGLRLRS
jgi:dimethylglycine dehydrogenase